MPRIEASRQIKDKKEEQIRYYLSSESHDNAHYFNLLARGHWGIENHLPWHLDVTFKEDEARARTGNVPLNMNILRKTALQKLDQVNDKLSKKKRRYKASLNNEYLIQILNF